MTEMFSWPRFGFYICDSTKMKKSWIYGSNKS